MSNDRSKLEAKLRMALRLPRDDQSGRVLQGLLKIEPTFKEGQKVEVYRDPDWEKRS